MRSDSIIVKKQCPADPHKVALYPDAEQKSIILSMFADPAEKVYQLFVFDMHGNVGKQAEIRNKQTTLIKGIEKGTTF